MSLTVAAAWVYTTWWPADRLIMRNLMLAGMTSVPVHGGTAGLDQLFGEVPEDLADPAPPEGTEAVAAPREEEADFAAPPNPDFEELAIQGQQVMTRLYVDMWVWLGVTTLAAAWLALSGGSAAAGLAVIDPAKRRLGVVVAVIAAVLAAWLARRLWQGQSIPVLPHSVAEVAFVACGLAVAYLLATSLSSRGAGLLAIVLALGLVGIGGWAWRDWYTQSFELFESYPLAAPRIVAVVLMVVAALAGAGMFRRSVGLHRIAVVLILVAAITTAAALKYAAANGGVHTQTLSGTTYVGLAAAQVSYAAVLIGVLAVRLR
jgi:hypothetical protein